jgi:hypothetical protein
MFHQPFVKLLALIAEKLFKGTNAPKNTMLGPIFVTGVLIISATAINLAMITLAVIVVLNAIR